MVRVHGFETESDAADAAARHIAGALIEAIDARGMASLALSGGSSPVPMLGFLASQQLEWSRVHVFQVDERIVPAGDEARNWTMLRALLVDEVGAVGHAMSVQPGLAAHAAALVRSSDASVMSRLAGAPPVLDVVHLGLGTDGHTASWPPGREIDDGVGLTEVAAFNGHDRVTLTPAVVNRARSIVWFVPGESKRHMLERLVGGDLTIPAGLVSRHQAELFTDVRV